MSIRRHHQISKFKAFAGVGAACAITAALAGCGASSSAPHSQPTQTARATPALSGADAGVSRVQNAARHRAAAKRSQAAAPGSHPAAARHPSAVTRTGASAGALATVVKARPTPATSKDDQTRTSVANTFNPCTLVSLGQAQSITGGAVSGRINAPLGPTCIYMQKGSQAHITLAIESVNFSQVAHQLRKSERVVVKGRTGYCAKLGTQMLFVPLPAHQTLHVVAPCGIAQRFATAALNHLAA